MAKSWYTDVEDKGKVIVGGTESEFSNELGTVFREIAKMADNGFDIVANRRLVSNINARVIIKSNTLSKHSEKVMSFEKGVLRIGDIINYQSKKYLASSWVNEEISMHDSMPLHFCNAVITYGIETEVITGTDPMGRPVKDISVTTFNIPSVFDTERFYSDDNQVVNLEKDVIECWIQYNQDLMNGLNIAVEAFGKKYTIEGILRDMLQVDAVTADDYYGVLKLRLRVKE